MVKPTTHFNEQWEAWVREPLPSVEELNQMIEEAVYLQQHRDLYNASGRRRRILAVYWHPERQIALKVDQQRNKVVTVLTPEARGERKTPSSKNPARSVRSARVKNALSDVRKNI